MKKAVDTIFFASWLLCGCSVEKIPDDWKACTVFVIGLATAILCAYAMGGKHD